MTADVLRHRCELCGAGPGRPCVNTVRPGAPLPGRRVHHARAATKGADVTRISREAVAETVGQLRAILAAVDAGELEVSATERARIEGAVLALDVLAGSYSKSL